MNFAKVDEYLGERGGCYEYRAVRYTAAGRALTVAGLSNTDTVYDIGAGFTEFDYCMRKTFDWRGRYAPIDWGISNIDLNAWEPEREVEFAVALEILEHLKDPERLVRALQRSVTKAIVVSVPNPRTVDVLGIDDTHVIEVTQAMLEDWGFKVEEKTFYGGVYSKGEPDALLAVWTPGVAIRAEYL